MKGTLTNRAMQPLLCGNCIGTELIDHWIQNMVDVSGIIVLGKIKKDPVSEVYLECRPAGMHGVIVWLLIS